MFLREVFLMAEAEVQASKPRYASVCQASPCVTSSSNSTVKACHMGEFYTRISGERSLLMEAG